MPVSNPFLGLLCGEYQVSGFASWKTTGEVFAQHLNSLQGGTEDGGNTGQYTTGKSCTDETQIRWTPAVTEGLQAER